MNNVLLRFAWEANDPCRDWQVDLTDGKMAERPSTVRKEANADEKYCIPLLIIGPFGIFTNIDIHRLNRVQM